jgi:acetate kinase
MNILTINARLSSIKFKIFRYHNKNKTSLIVSAYLRIDKPHTLTIKSLGAEYTESIDLDVDNLYISAINIILQNIKFNQYAIDCTISKIAHGGEEYTDIILLHSKTLDVLSKYNNLFPQIQPYNILVAQYFLDMFPKIKHYACFDNSFHHTVPKINRILPDNPDGIKGYGVHGLSAAYLTQRLNFLVDSKLAKGYWVLVHLGITSSICGIKKSKSLVTHSIAAPSGIFLSIADGVDIHEEAYKESKFLFETYALSVASKISMTATHLGGVDGIVFTGNISENSPEIRKLILDRLQWLGAIINKKANNNNKLKISDKDSDITVLLVPTNEGVTMVNQLIEHKL